MNSLFSEESFIKLRDAELVVLENFLPDDRNWLELLASGLNWRQDSIRIAGKQIPIPRLQSWYGDENAFYSYSGLELQPSAWQESLSEIRKRLEAVEKTEFNSVLCNYYRDENDSVGWHSDNEPELGKSPVIASVSIGETRRFELRRKDNRREKHCIELPSLSLLIMKGLTQDYWEHQVPKERFPCAARINLTFRKIISGN